ncbi:MAG: porin [Pseudomonadota bacterium]|nr:porin [Pseudomonadota bacterium]
MRVTRIGGAFLAGAALSPLAYAQSAPIEFESDLEAVTVLAAFHDTKPGMDSEDILYEISLDNRIKKVLENGVQIGGRLTLRGQRDHPSRPGFLGDFGPGTGPAQTGAYSGFSQAEMPADTGARGQLEAAYLEIEGGYGELRLGRDRGVSARFFEGAPHVLSHASIANAYLDPDGIKVVRTNHDLTGPSAKISYATPRILGLRAAASFTPDPDAAGLDRNIRDSGVEMSNAAEFALNLSRRLPSSGVRLETALAWSTAEVDSQASAARDRVSTFSAGGNLEFDSFEIGGSWLKSNNGFDAADYTAWEIGIATEIGETELSLNYGEADDDLAQLTGDGISLAAKRDITAGLELAVAYQDETLSAAADEYGGRGIVVEITLSSDFLGLNGN